MRYVAFLVGLFAFLPGVLADIPPKVRFIPETGEFHFRHTTLDGKTQNARLGPLVVDGEPIARLIPVEEHPDTWTASGVRVSLETISPGATAIRWSVDDGRSKHLTLKIHGSHASFGGGERFNTLNLWGHNLEMVSTDHPEPKGGVSYKPVPFYMSSAGYAVWVDSFVPGRFDFNAHDRNAVTIDYDADSVRVVLIDGPRFSDMLDNFTALSGRPRMPPTWAFGLWKSRDVHRNRDDVLEDVEKLREHDIPASVLVIDSPWEIGYNDFEINRAQFSDPEALFARVRELGFHTCFWLTPFINTKNVQDMHDIDPGPTSTYAEAARLGYFVKDDKGEPLIMNWWKGDGSLIDFTNPKATQWWQNQLAKTKQWGGTAFKCDDGEGNFIGDAHFADGSSADMMRNRYSMLYLEATRGYLDDALDGDGTIIGRSGFAGMHAHAMGWAGDNAADWSLENGLPSVVLAAQSAALSGQPYWGSDISGYMGTQSKELFIRWTQFGCFSPQMMVHMQSNLGPWDFDDETLRIFRDYAKLHTRLVPYIEAAARVAARSGMPIIRPMMLAFQDDPAAWQHVFQYMFGPDLLVAPMITPGTHRTLYLPKGEWIDFWTGETQTGERLIEVEASFERIPLFVRPGAIFVTFPLDVDTLIPRHKDMADDVVAIDARRVLQIWPGKSGGISAIDGISATMQRQGAECKLEITCDPPRPLAIEVMHREATNISTAKGVEFETRRSETATGTMITLKSSLPSATLTWIED